MNREITFRAWDKKECRMMVPDGLRNPVSSLNPDRYEHMQFTGLKDKNGKEIYEGDIVIIATKYPTNKVPQIVGWDDTEARFCFIYDTGEPIFEVIGNIYENPELLGADRRECPRCGWKTCECRNGKAPDDMSGATPGDR